MKNTGNKIWYPTTKRIESINKLMIKKFRATKAERFQVRSSSQIKQALKETKEFPGVIEDKAAILVRKLQYHPFASANRRTAYFAMNEFLWKNKKYALAKNKLKGKEFMGKIRRGELSHEQIKKEISLI